MPNLIRFNPHFTFIITQLFGTTVKLLNVVLTVCDGEAST